jgi:hypothetical protein
VRVPVAGGGQAHQGEDFLCPCPPFGAVDLAYAQAEGDVVAGSHVGEETVCLKHHAHVALVGWDMADVSAFDEDIAGLSLFETGDNAQHGGLAGAARSQQRDEFAGRDVKVDIFENRRLAK